MGTFPGKRTTRGSREQLTPLFPLRVGRGPAAGTQGTSRLVALTSCWLQFENQDDRRVPRRLPLPPCSAPATLPGSFSHLGTFPRSLLTGWTAPGLGSERPTAPASAAGSDSRGAGSGAGIGDGVPAALDMHLRAKGRGIGWLACQGRASPLPTAGAHLATSMSAADGETVCSNSRGSRKRPAGHGAHPPVIETPSPPLLWEGRGWGPGRCLSWE